MNTARDLDGKIAKQYNTYDLSGEYGIGWTNKGEEFWFDLEDYDKIKDYCWHFNPNGHLITTERGGTKRIIFHRFVMEPIPDGMVVDHLIHPPGNENKYDNRKGNLQIKTPQQNSMNSCPHSNNKSGVSGVTEQDNKWIARIGYKGKRILLGIFENFEDAVRARKDGEEKYWGEYGYNNINSKYSQEEGYGSKCRVDV